MDEPKNKSKDVAKPPQQMDTSSGTEEEQENKTSSSKATETQITIHDKKIIFKKNAPELHGFLLGADG